MIGKVKPWWACEHCFPLVMADVRPRQPVITVIHRGKVCNWRREPLDHAVYLAAPPPPWAATTQPGRRAA